MIETGQIPTLYQPEKLNISTTLKNADWYIIKAEGERYI